MLLPQRYYFVNIFIIFSTKKKKNQTNILFLRNLTLHKIRVTTKFCSTIKLWRRKHKRKIHSYNSSRTTNVWERGSSPTLLSIRASLSHSLTLLLIVINRIISSDIEIRNFALLSLPKVILPFANDYY